MDIKVVKGIVIPHVVKVAFFVGISAVLTYLANNIGQFHWNESTQGIVILLINSVLAGIKKYKDEA